MRWLALVLMACPVLSQDPPQIDPAPNGQPIHIAPVEGKDRVAIVNDTHLFLSVSTVDLASGDTLLSYAPAEAVSLEPNLIFPQSGVATGARSNEVELGQPRGRNARVLAVTAGLADGEEMTPEEQELHDGLFARTLVDGVLVPIITSAAGQWLPANSGKQAALKAALTTAILQNRLWLEELRRNARSGDGYQFGSVALNGLLRDFDASGPLSSAIYNHAGIKIRDLIVRRLGEDFAKKWIPFYNAVSTLKNLINWGPTVVDVVHVAYDLRTTPTKSSFAVYFRPGVGSIEPRVVRTDREDKVFTIRGHRLNDPRRWPKVHFHDRAGARFLTVDPFEVDDIGYQMKVLVPASRLRDLTGFITCRVTFGSEEHRVPDRIQLINQFRINRVDPPEGHPGQSIRIYGDDLYPFVICNKVRFERENGSGRVDVRPSVVGRRHLIVTVPPLAEGTWRVSVVERYSDRILESNTLPFTRLPGTLAEAEEARRNARMKLPEDPEIYEGVLTPQEPEKVYKIDVPAGMEIQAELESLDGPRGDEDRFSLDHWGVALSHRGRSEWIGLHRGPIGLRQPAQRVRHATHGEHDAHLYLLRLKRRVGEEIHFRVRVTRERRDDRSTGYDAPGRVSGNGEFLLDVGEPRTAYLFGDPGQFHGDGDDWYAIPDVPESQRVVVTLTSISSTPNADVRLGRVRLLRERDGRLEEAAVSAANLGSRDLPVTLRHDDVEARSYRLHVSHGEGKVEYRLGLRIENIGGPELARDPIRSTFNQGTDDGWTVVGNFASGHEPPELQITDIGNGWLRCSDPPSGPSGPLDIVFAVDTTGSMGAAIVSVRDATRAIIEELRRRSTSLRVGLVSFKDHAADAASARVMTPLTDRVEDCLATVAAWTAGGGGSDGPEDALYAVAGALEMGWRPKDDRGVEVARAVVLITDAGFKTGADGRDFGGRSIESIGEAARARGVRVYPMPIGGDGALSDQASRLAARADGRMVAAGRPEDVARTILGLVEYVVDRTSPRYFSAPRKFLGNVSRFYGTTLDFETRSSGKGRRFHAADLVLRGGGRTLELRTLLPEGLPGPWGTSAFARCSVRLEAERTRWMLGGGGRASREDLEAVLADLKELRIRGELFSGEDVTELDNVVLGGNGPATDLGATDMGTLDFLMERERTMSVLQARFVERYSRPDGLLIERLRAGGVADASLGAWAGSYRISGPLTSGVRSAAARVFEQEIDRVRRNIDHVRANGIPKREDTQALLTGSRNWFERRQRLQALADELVEQVAAEGIAEHRRGIEPANFRAHEEKRSRAREAQERIVRDLEALTPQPAWPLLHP